MNQPRLPDTRNQRQDQVDYTPPAGPALFKAAIRGAIATTKAVYDAQILIHQASTQRERQIAQTNYRNRVMENQEAHALLQQAQQSLAEKKFDHGVEQDKAEALWKQEQIDNALAIIDQGVANEHIPKEIETHYRLGVYNAALGGLGISHENIMKQIGERAEQQRKTNEARLQAEDDAEQTELDAIKRRIVGSKDIPDNLKPLFVLKAEGVDTSPLISDVLKDDKDQPLDLSAIPDNQLPVPQRQMLINATNQMTPQAQASAQHAFIGSDEANRKVQLINLAGSKFGAEQRSALLGKWVLSQRTKEIADNLAEMKAAGVDLGRISGTWNQVVEKLTGTTTDPLISEFKTELLVTIMNFRRAMSGAAFTESESREYQRIFPGIASSWELNLARLEGLDNVVKSELKTTYLSTLGPNATFVYDAVPGIDLNTPFQIPDIFSETDAPPTTADLTPPSVIEAGQPTPVDKKEPEEVSIAQFVAVHAATAIANEMTEADVRLMLPDSLRTKQGITDENLINEIVNAVIAQLNQNTEENPDDASGEEEPTDDEQ